jgi:hypothetical protein
MYKSMLFLHWKQIRPALALTVVAAFALPLLMVSSLGTPPGMDAMSLEAYRIVGGVDEWLLFFPLLAIAIGVTLALSSWNWDHQLNHVYALSLPVTRWEYTLQKLLAGMTLALIPAAGLWLGARLAAASIELPEGLHAYPNELAVRFSFAVLVSYAVLFSMAAGTTKTTLKIMSVVLGFVFFGVMANDFLATYYPYFDRVQIVEGVFEWMMQAPGPFEVFTGNWSLIDV